VALSDIAWHDRPRERAEKRGVSALSERELVVAVLGSGTAAGGVLELSESLTRRGLPWLSRASVRELMTVPGIGIAQASRLAAAFELGRRLDRVEGGASRISRAGTVARIARSYLGHERQEVLLAILLTSKLGLLRVVEVARGSCSGASFSPADVLAPALREGAPRLAIAHNHPSGDPTPSREDVATTARLLASAKTLGLDLVDHVVVGSRRTFSFARARLLG
jgi:DNA repair protein RadC